MSLRQRLLDLLSRGDPPERDPDEFVEIALVPLSQAPVLVNGLRDAGFDTQLLERYSYVNATLSDASIRVARRDAAAATEALDRLRS
jgi:hypothetical protein